MTESYEVSRRDFTKLLAAGASGTMAGCKDTEYPSHDFESLDDETLKELQGEKFSIEAYVADDHDRPVYYKYRTVEGELQMREPRRVVEVYGSEDETETEPILLLNDHAEYAVGDSSDYRLRVRAKKYFLDKEREEHGYGLMLDGGASEL